MEAPESSRSLARNGLDINNPREMHVLRSLPGRTVSVLELVCIMHGGLQEDRARDGWRGGGSRRGVGNSGEIEEKKTMGLSSNVSSGPIRRRGID